ncbi:MAG TPA: polysaccharide deacetylase family protein [Paludibacteraceae bacterium]|nr:polysaccharide deacetylase family protein [Paludibacteraceae bacterium]
MKMQEVIEYIIRFLLGDESSTEIANLIGYTSDKEEFSHYKLVIYPSDFFQPEVYGTPQTLPVLPLKIWEDTPILFGQPKIEKIGQTRILYADIIASTYFLITRYEEMIRPECRDVHGRFPGKESISYRAGFIDRPLVDEYGKLLRKQLRELGIDVPEPSKKIKKIFLTHDVDQLAHYRRFRGMMGALWRGIKQPNKRPEAKRAIKTFFKGIRFDPWYTFPWLFKMDLSLIDILGKERCEIIVFIKAGGGKQREDKPHSNLVHPDYQNLIKYCKRKNITIGLHTSYKAGKYPELIAEEKKRLERNAKVKIYYNRNHFLRMCEPEDMETLIQAGITDDFTLTYADVAGFRIGTCRPVKWINPKNKELTSLTLHPMTIMDSTLSDKRYMNMSAYDAYEYCVQLINNIENYGGEFVLLWHNTMVEEKSQSYHRTLYQNIIDYLKTK